MELPMTRVMSNLVLAYLEMKLISMQDRWTVCVKHAIGLGIILDAPNVGYLGHVETPFSSFGDGVSVGAR
jgi:hypothetical protein